MIQENLQTEINMIKHPRVTTLVCLVFLLVSASIVEADVVLIFEPHPGNGQTVSQQYGDRVTALEQNGFIYGQTEPGFTPNIEVEYANDIRHWNASYGDMLNVLYEQNSQFLEISFTADDDFEVLLHGFDLGGWPNTDYTIPGVAVTDGSGSALFEESDVVVHGDATGPPRTSFEFGSPIRSSSLTISIDTGAFGDSIGIDNIRFSQTAIPEPSAFLFLSTLLIGAATARRKTNRHSLPR